MGVGTYADNGDFFDAVVLGHCDCLLRSSKGNSEQWNHENGMKYNVRMEEKTGIWFG